MMGGLLRLRRMLQGKVFRAAADTTLGRALRLAKRSKAFEYNLGLDFRRRTLLLSRNPVFGGATLRHSTVNVVETLSPPEVGRAMRTSGRSLISVVYEVLRRGLNWRAAMNFGDLKIPHKLMAVFAVMLTTIAIMGVTLFFNQMEYEGSVQRTEQAHEALRAADTAAFRLTRQENSLRGFLLSGDEYYVKRLEEAHKPKFLAALDDLRTLAKGDEAELAGSPPSTPPTPTIAKAIEPGEALGRDPATHQQASTWSSTTASPTRRSPVEDAIEAIVKDAEAVSPPRRPPRRSRRWKPA
jgi:hypothetical protein